MDYRLVLALTAVIVPRSTDVSEEQALIDAGNVVATEGTYAGSFNMFAHNFNQGNGWKASFEVGDYVIINNTYKFQIYDIGNGYQDDDGYLWYQGRKAINPDLMADLVVNTCNKGNSRFTEDRLYSFPRNRTCSRNKDT